MSARPRRRAETEGGQPPDGYRVGPARLTRWEAVVVIAVVIIVALGVTALVLPSHKPDTASAGPSALAASRGDLSNLLAVTSTSSAAVVQTALRGTTASFARSYTDGTSAVKQLLNAGALRSSGGIQQLGLSSVHGATARILAVAQAYVDGTQVSYHLIVTMKHSGSQWLIDDLEFAK